MNLRRASNGMRVRLGPELGRGGEGAVFPVIDDPSRVAKIYFKAPSAAKVEKLRVMCRAATPALLRVAAWPVELLEDEAHRVRGFLMPRVAAREDAHQLYSPRSRRRAFPDADFRFLVRAATNVARAFAQVHAAGHVIGDVNHGNALIGKDATVVLIDCDSFQIRDATARVFTCDVGVPLFTPPELQNLGYRGRKRSARHDVFGLAVLLFHLLFQGRHPYAGLYDGGEMPIERAIAEARFAYGASAPSLGMHPPPATLPFGTFGPWIARLFERAFAPTGEAARPAAREWVDALEALERELVACNASPSHFHPPGPGCCWCGIERQSGVHLFGAVTIGELGEVAISALWGAIRAVPKPATDRMFQLKHARTHIPKAPRSSTKIKYLPGWIAYLVITGLYALLMGLQQFGEQLAVGTVICAMALILGISAWRSARKKALKTLRAAGKTALGRAERDWKRMVERWNAECSTALFNLELKRLQAAQHELASFESKRRVEMRRMKRDQEARARELYLLQFNIEAEEFGLKPSEIAALASFGFESAADVVFRMPKVMGVLSESRAKKLLEWARDLDSKFQFRRRGPPDPRLVAEVEQRLADRRRELLATLRAGPGQLEKKRREIEDARVRMEPAMDAAMKELRAARVAEGQSET